MFLLFQSLLYSFVAWFYTLPDLAGIIFLLGPAFFLLLFQFKVYKKTPLPGIISILLMFASYKFFFGRATVVNFVDVQLVSLQEPSSTMLAVPWIEFLFRFFVGPLSTRHIYQEVISLFLVCYLISVAYHSYKEYKKDGRMIGDMSLGAFLTAKQKRPKRSLSNELGSGDLASSEQIAEVTKPSGKPGDTALTVADIRGSEGIAAKQARLVWSREKRNQHILVIAKTGGGKTTKVILPILYEDCLDPDRSTIVLDSKPEMWRKLAAMTRKYNPNKNIMLFNPLDLARSMSWNILGKIEDDTDCKLIANTIIMATDQPQSKSDSPFFRNNALSILNSIMVGLLHDPAETLSMPRIHEIVQSGMRPLCDWLEAHPAALRNTRTFVELARSGSQNADTIMSELSMRLSAWDLPAIRATTSVSELDIETIVTKPTLFIVELRESELEMLRPMANVIIVELLRFLTKFAERCPGVTLPRPVGFVIDEFASALGRLPDIHVKLNTLRSRNVSITAAIQSIGQVKALYSEHADSVLAGFTTKMFVPTLEQTDSEWASKESGQMTIRFQTASTGSNRKIIEFFASKNDSTQEQVQQRAVLTQDEIGRPVDSIVTFFMPNTPVFQGHLVPFYKIPEMRKRLAEFDNEASELKMRDTPIDINLSMGNTSAAPAGGAAGGTAPAYNPADPNALPPGVSDTRGWPEDQVKKKVEEVRAKLDWDNTTGSARKWWEAFENENKTRMALVLRLAEELLIRKATITEFFLAYVYSNTDNIQANLHYLDYTRLKKEEEKKKRDMAQAA